MMSGAHATVLSNLVKEMHAGLGGAVVNLRTLDVPGDDEALSVVLVEEIEGRTVRTGRDIRRFLKGVPQELKDDAGVYLFTIYHPESGRTLMGVAKGEPGAGLG